MRSIAAGLVAILFLPSLAIAAVDPAEREAALRYELTVQEGNLGLREASRQTDSLLLGLLKNKPPSEKEIGDSLDALQKSVKDFQQRLKAASPPASAEAKAYASAIFAYLSALEKYNKEDYLAAMKNLERGTGDPAQALAALEPIHKVSRSTKAAIEELRNARSAFLAVYEITPADLRRALAPAAAGTRPAGGSTPPDRAAPPGGPMPLAGAVALDRAIRDGEAAFESSVKDLQIRLLPKLLLGGKIEPAELEKAVAGIATSISRFETSLAAVQVPDDPESKAYFTAAKNLLAGTKKIDFTAIGALLTDASAPSEEKQKQLLDKLKGMEAGYRKDFDAFKSAQEAFRTKHGIPSTDDAATTPMPPGQSARPLGTMSPAAGPSESPLPAFSPLNFGAEATSPAEPAAPLTGPAKLDKAIRDGEQAFRESTQALHTNLLSKVASGDVPEPAEIQQSFAAVAAGIAQFEQQLASAEVPDDPESKAYIAAARRLVANLKKADFAGLARIVGNKALTAEARQNQISKKVGGLSAGIERDLATFEKARKVFLEKHKLPGQNGTDGAPSIGAGGVGMP